MHVVWREVSKDKEGPSSRIPGSPNERFPTKRATHWRWWATGVVLAMVCLMEIKRAFFPASVAPVLLTTTVKIADVEQSVLAEGVIGPSRLVSVGAQTSGRIMALHVALGDRVSKGELVAEIDPSTQRNALLNAEAVLAQDRAQRASRAAAFRQADLVFTRASATYEKRLTSRADYDAAQAAYDSAKADLAALDAQTHAASIAVDLARVALSYTRLIAPMSGTVVAIVAPEGQTVNAVQSAPTIVKLADLETMTVKVRISEADVPHVHPGQSLYFTILADPTHRYYAKLRAVEPAPESLSVDASMAAPQPSDEKASKAVYYNGLFDVLNPQHELQPSMTAQVNIILGQASGVPSIPASALGELTSDGRYLVRVLDSNKHVEVRKVKVGLNNHVVAQIIEGLRAGDQVVLGDSATVDAGHAAAKNSSG